MSEAVASKRPMATDGTRPRAIALALVWLLVLGTSVLLATPAAACECVQQTNTREEVLLRGGGIDGTVELVSEPYQRTAPPNLEDWVVDVELAVVRAYGADPGAELTLPAIPESVEVGDGRYVDSSCGIDLQPGRPVSLFLDEEILTSCSPVAGGFDATLADPSPTTTAHPVRFLGLPAEPGSSLAGLTDTGAYVSQVALPSPGPLIRCPGDTSAIVQHGGEVFTGVEDIIWSRLDLTTLAVEELIDIATLNPDPTQLQNVFAGAVCLAPDASDVLALFSWWERPDEKPQRLVRITDGVVTEVAVAPIWQIWSHDATVYARVGEGGTDIVALDPATGATTPHGTLPTSGVLSIAADGSWGLLTDFDTTTGPSTVQRIQLIPDVAVTATRTVTDRFVQALADGRTMVSLPPSAGGPLLEVLNEALQVEGAWPVEGAGTGLAVVAQDPEGAWLADRDGRLTRLDRGVNPAPTDIHADMVLPVQVIPAEPFPLTQIDVITYDQPPAPTPSTTPSTAPQPAGASAASTPAATGSMPPVGVNWPTITAGMLGLALVGGLLALSRRSSRRDV